VQCRRAHREEDAPGRPRRAARPSRAGQPCASCKRGNRLSITPVDPAEWKFITGKLIKGNEMTIWWLAYPLLGVFAGFVAGLLRRRRRR
jgi:hypothetical protein